MLSQFAFPALAVISLSHASPLTKRNVCDGVNATPQLYHEYLSDVCTPVYTMNDQGVCDHTDAYANNCEAFCQVRTTFTYHTEQPFENSYCHGPLTCTITETSTETVTKSVNVNPSWLQGLKVGISGGYSWSDAKAVARAFSIKLDAGSCGYFTAVPVWRTTCGSMSTRSVSFLQPSTFYCDGATQTTGNVCADDVRLNSDGTADTETIFVYTDCNDRTPLDPSKQDPIYQNPGVPLDRGLYAALASEWAQVQPASQGPTASTPQCGPSYDAPASDVETINQQLDNQGSQQCCTNSQIGCEIMGSSGLASVALCTTNGAPSGQLCVSCARLANYVEGLKNGCQQGGNVGGSQDIVETPGLQVQININDT